MRIIQTQLLVLTYTDQLFAAFCRDDCCITLSEPICVFEMVFTFWEYQIKFIKIFCLFNKLRLTCVTRGFARMTEARCTEEKIARPGTDRFRLTLAGYIIRRFAKPWHIVAPLFFKMTVTFVPFKLIAYYSKLTIMRGSHFGKCENGATVTNSAKSYIKISNPKGIDFSPSIYFLLK